ncbi:MAG: hypothetical protein WBM83_10250 [Flavobacteriaceae bacterium]
MKTSKLLFQLILLSFVLTVNAQEPEQDSGDYLEFNDRKSVVHGVYLGLNLAYGEIDGKDTYNPGIKIAYVANQQFEVGFEAKFIYSEQNIFNAQNAVNEDLIGGYAGLHLEPILFSKSLVNLSFPLLVGMGAVGYVDREAIKREEDVNLDENSVALLFVAEPGVSALFNINRYLQLEAGIKYRFSNKIDLANSPVSRINGFSAGIGIKVGVFNMGRNRYRKNVD